jgi:hypothetical protein
VSDDPAQLTRQRVDACDELLQAVASWIGPVETSPNDPWLIKRQTELILRAIQTMQATVLIARQGLWIPAYALARLLLEDAAIAHWLAVHPQLDTLEVRWQEHLDAAILGDLKNQEDLDLELDPVTLDWKAKQDPGYLDHVAHRHGHGTYHWTGKSITQLVTGAAARGAPKRVGWDDRTKQLVSANRRMQLIVNLGTHHSPAASQNWYAPPDEMLPDGLRAAWLLFWLHAVVAIEELAPERLDDLRDLLERQADHFWMGPPASSL